MLAGLGLAALPARPGQAAGAVTPCIIGKDGWLFPIWDEVRQSNPAAIARVAKTIVSAVATLQAAKIEVALSLIPAKSRVYRDFLPGDYQLSPEAARRYATAYEAIRPSGAIMFDQAAFFEAARRAQPVTDLFFRADSHWVAAAAAAAAGEMARQIKRAGHLPPSSQPGATLSAPKLALQEHNDLAALLPPAEQAKYPFQSYDRREPVADATAGLLEDEVTDTTVVGSSFMQPAYGYAANLSAGLGRPVGLLWKVHQFSPYFTLLAYLRSDAFKRQRPRLIVWNFQEPDMETPADLAGAWGPNAMAPSAFLSELAQLLSA